MKLYRILTILALISLTVSGCTIRDNTSYPDVTDTVTDTAFVESESDEPESDETPDFSDDVYEDTELFQTESPEIEVPKIELTEIAETEPETQPPETEAVIIEETSPPKPPAPPPETEKAPEPAIQVIPEVVPEITTEAAPEVIPEVIPEVSPEVIPPPPVEVYAVVVSSSRQNYKIGESASLTVTVYPDNAENKNYNFTVTSGNAEVSGSTISLYEDGKITVRATCENGVYGEIIFEVVDVAKYADEVLKYTNIARAENGLSELSASDASLSSVASARVNELMEVYSHTRPNGSDCYELYREKGITYTMAAENIGKGFTDPENIVKLWMESPSHMKNILNPGFAKIGVAVEMDSNGTLYWTQNFSN